MTARSRIPVSGRVLRWAREQRGLYLEVAAKRLQISEERLTAIEAEELLPSTAQLRKMSEQYKRPMIVLLLDEPPTTFTPLRDFRSLPETQLGSFSPQLRDEIKRASQQQEAYLELKNEMGETLSRPRLPSRNQSPQALGEQLRKVLDVSYAEQRRWSDPKVALAEWRSRLEGLGILVLETSRVKLKEMRGFSLSEQLPLVVIVNGEDSERGKVFTMLHELAHLTLREPGVCDLHSRRMADSDAEVFCNAVSAHTLLPTQIISDWGVVENHTTGQRWSDDEFKRMVSMAGGASQEVILRRLVDMQLATRREYERRREEWQEAYEEWRRERSRKSTGGPPPHRVQLRDRGRPFVRSVFDAYADGLVSLSEVVDLTGVRTKHLRNLQREAYG